MDPVRTLLGIRLHLLRDPGPCREAPDDPEGHAERIRAHMERVAREEPEAQRREHAVEHWWNSRRVPFATWRRLIALYLFANGPKTAAALVQAVGVPFQSLYKVASYGSPAWFVRDDSGSRAKGRLWRLTKAGRQAAQEIKEEEAECSTTA